MKRRGLFSRLPSKNGAVRGGWLAGKPALHLSLAAAVTLVLGHGAMADTAVWTNTGTTDFNTGSNWTGGTGPGGIPSALDNATFSALAPSVLPDISSILTIQGLTFSTTAGGWTLSSANNSVLTLTNTGTGATSAINATNTSGTNTISARLELGEAAGQTATFTQATGGTLAISGNITSTNAIAGLSLAGGTIRLSGNNTYQGTTTLTNSTILQINSATAIGSGALFASGSSTVRIDNTSGAALVLTNNNAINLGSNLQYVGSTANNLSFGSGVLTVIGANRTMTVSAGTLTIGSIDADTTARTLNKQGIDGTLVITGAASANFQGGFTWTGGLIVGHKNALGSGPITATGPNTLQASTDLSGANKISNSVTFNDLRVSGTNNIEIGGKLIGSFLGQGVLTSSLSGGAQLTLNDVDISKDTLSINHIWNIAGTGNTVINGVVANGNAAGGLNRVSVVNMGTGTTTFNGNNTFNGLLMVQNALGGVVNLNGNNIAASGGVTLFGGKINVGSATALGTGTFTLLNGGTLDNITGNALTLTTNNAVDLSGTLTFSTSAGTANNNLTFGNGDITTVGGTIILNGTGTLSFGGVLKNDGSNALNMQVNNGAGTSFATSVRFGGLALSGASSTAAVADIIRGSGNVAITGVVSDGTFAGSSLSYTGTARLTLSGNSTFTGGMTLNNATGVLALGSDSSPSGVGSAVTSGPVGTGTLTLTQGNLIGLGGTRTIANDIALTAVTIGGNENVIFNGRTTLTGNSTVTINNPATTFGGTFMLRNATGNTPLAGRTLTFAGSGGLVVSGAIVNGVTTNGLVILASGGTPFQGTAVFSGNNSYTGNTTVGSQATLRLGHPNALGFGGAGSAAGNTSVTAGGTLDLNGQSGITESIFLNGAGIGGNGALINSNASTPAMLNSGIAALSVTTSGSGYGAGTTVTITGTGTGATAAASLGLTSASFTISGTTTYTVAPTVTISGGGGQGAVAIAVLTSGRVTGITLATNGQGRDYTSAPTLTFSGGTVLVPGIDPTATGNADNFTIVALQVTNAGSGYTGKPLATISGTGTGAEASALASVLDLNSAASIGGVGDILVNSSVGGTALTKVGTGKLILAGDNGYTGTTISAGTLQIGNGGTTGDLGGATVTNNAALVFNRSNTLSVSNAISGTGTVTNNGGAASVLNLNGAQTYPTFNANGGTTNLNAAFVGTNVVVNGGTLLVNTGGSIKTPNATTVSNGGTLGGSGGTVADILVNATGALAPGASIGTLNAANVSLTADAVFELEISTFDFTTDVLASVGSISLALTNDAVLAVSDLNVVPVLMGDLAFMTYTGSWNGGLFEVGGVVIDDYDALTNPNSTVFSVGGNYYQIDYNAGSPGARSVALHVTPEPSAMLMLVGGAGMLVGSRRRRR